MKSYGSVKVFEPETEKIYSELDQYVRTLSTRPEVCGVWLIGSFHRKDFGPFSDIDLVVIVNQTSIRFLDRPLEYLPQFFSVSVDLFVYTLEEIEIMRTSQNFFWKEIEDQHTTLFDRKTLPKHPFRANDIVEES